MIVITRIVRLPSTIRLNRSQQEDLADIIRRMLLDKGFEVVTEVK